MKNILNIARYDLKKITGSVVSIVVIMGLCIVPCSYAWFNILSNWAPYESEATGRIPVAVASEDKGATVAGLTLNVGDTIIEALKANDDIGWVFVDDGKEAVDGVYASKYYAALIIPEDFTRDVLSFSSGSLKNPEIKYYENEKKNAIAPKITGKAESALREQVNATFVETLASYIASAASVANATGMSPAEVMSDLADKTESLSGDVQSLIVLSRSAASLTAAAGDLMDASGNLMSSAQNVLTENDKLLDTMDSDVRSKTTAAANNVTKARDAAYQAAQDTESYLIGLREEAVLLQKDPSIETAWKAFLDSNTLRVIEMKERQKIASASASALSSAGYTEMAADYTSLAEKLADIQADLETFTAEMTEAERLTGLKKLIEDIDAANLIIDSIETRTHADISETLAQAFARSRSSIASYRTALYNANADLGKLSSLMTKYGKNLDKLQKNVKKTASNMEALQDGLGNLSNRLSGVAGNELLSSLMSVLGDDETAVAEYLANPIKMETVTIWPIENYGSAMAPFYTVLAQAVGALLTSVLIKTNVRKREDLKDLKLHQRFFGRYGVYAAVGLAQALIVSIGDLAYLDIQCLHPLHFVFAACVISLVFMMIDYALVFALDRIGMGAGVIVLLAQVAGGGGTFPHEVLPDVFKAIYPFMPFRYAMDAMRECVGGMYDGYYWKCIGILMIFAVVFVIIGLLLHKPAQLINKPIANSLADTDIML